MASASDRPWATYPRLPDGTAAGARAATRLRPSLAGGPRAHVAGGTPGSGPLELLVLEGLATELGAGRFRLEVRAPLRRRVSAVVC